MTDADDVAARTREILAKVDREVERRKAEEIAKPEPEPEPEPETEAEPAAASETPAAEATAQAQAQALEQAPVIAPARLTPGPLAASTEPVAVPPRPISVPPTGAMPAAGPQTPEELASGVAAARRRLAIITVQLDELANNVEQLAAFVPGGVEGLPGAPIAPKRTGPPPVAMAPLPRQAPEPEPEPVEPEPQAEAEAEVQADDADGYEIEQPLSRPPVGGMRVRPRPPVQHHRELSTIETARKIAVELAVQGQPRGAVEHVLREEVGLTETDAVLNPIYGLDTGPDALMLRP